MPIMQEIVVKKKNFQIEAFIDSILRYMGSQIGEGLNPLDAMMIFPPTGDSGFIGIDSENDKDLSIKLTEGNILFFVFRAPDFGKAMKCADGEIHKHKKKDDNPIDNQSALGFLMKMENDCFYINSAVASSDEGGNWLCVRDSISFDKPMIDYVKGFISK